MPRGTGGAGTTSQQAEAPVACFFLCLGGSQGQEVIVQFVERCMGCSRESDVFSCFSRGEVASKIVEQCNMDIN